MKLKNKKIVMIAVSILCIVAALICLVFLFQRPEDRLSEEQIAALREEYPICEEIFPPYMAVAPPSLKRTAPLMDSFVYGEVVKVETATISDKYYYKYTISVIDDTENQYVKGEEIEISNRPPDYISFTPYLKEGMKVVIPVNRNDSIEKLHTCTIVGLYYVTDDGYVISAFDEEQAEVTPALSGLRLKQFFRELKEYRVVD